jgi:hypothetical protein
MSIFSKKVNLYDSGYKKPAPIKLRTPKAKELPQFEQQRRAMEKIYAGGKGSGKNFGKGVGP